MRRSQRLNNRASLESTLQMVRETDTRTGMVERQLRAAHDENSKLRAELHKVRDDLNLKEQELRHSALKQDGLETQLNSASSSNTTQDDA